MSNANGMGYPLGQLIKALAGTGEGAAARARRWELVLGGLADGTLRIGSRTPVANTPAWVTLEVLHGGFATGEHAAGGPLQPHEHAWLAAAPPHMQGAERAALNLHFLGDAGRADLETMLETGCFRVQVPEEGALLVVDWLLRHGESERAGTLLKVLGPFFERLRFYPVPHAQPLRSGLDIHVHTAGEVVASLRAKKPQRAVARMNESLRIWAPLYDRTVALFLETVDGDEGWPCRRYPPDWRDRAQALLDDYHAARNVHTLCRKPEKRKENFARLRRCMEIILTDPNALTGGDVGMIRKILASFVARRGKPGSERCRNARAAQGRTAAKPTHVEMARALAARLAPYAPDEGIPHIDDLLGPLTDMEASQIGAKAGEPIPEPLAAKALRCLEAPIDSLFERGRIPSSETLAKVLPSLTAQVRAAAIVDPELQRIYRAVYLAFRRRRSLLLLNLESQVKLTELPWMAVIQPWMASDEASQRKARETLVHTATLVLRAFPHTILPNTLTKEFRALAAGAGLSPPWVDELAADIFMGAFSETFMRAAKTAARALEGSLYPRYYGIPCDRLANLRDSDTSQLHAICQELATSHANGPWSVARNGTIIEQAQILTTHNLVLLFDALHVAPGLDIPSMARHTFTWICRRQRRILPDWHTRLTMMKNTAYAWRQMIFYLAHLDRSDQDAFLEWGSSHLEKQRLVFQTRFEPVWAGLRSVAKGHHFNEDGIHSASGGRRFLGWSIGKHWLLP
ncbi:hypothetical protein LZC95_29650 [Pendulispora brunnea]|uniref:DUF4123 domain-containing protein n=1 Tax=Pendulispora brunnea TaxID=2905690 RepID=A0ABZ2JZU2_9BACT